MPTTPEYQWLDNDRALREWLARLDPGEPLYLDTEFMRERVFWAQLALIQIQTRRELVLIDPTHLEPATLTELVAGRHLVMHGCSEDLEVLWQTTGRLPARMGDTQIAAALTGSDLQCGYQRLVADWLGIDLLKGATRTDWLQRPLSGEQLRYALQDVEYLAPLAEQLSERLREQGRVAWWQEECERMLQEATRAPAASELWRRVKGAGKLPPDQRAVLQSLAAWRDEQARARNLPRGFVIRDEDLLQLADRKPASLTALRGLGLHPALIRRDGEALVRHIQAADFEHPPPAPVAPPDRAQRTLIKRLREEVAARARALELEPEVLMRRRWLEALVRDPASVPEALNGWRRTVITEPLLELMA